MESHPVPYPETFYCAGTPDSVIVTRNNFAIINERSARDVRLCVTEGLSSSLSPLSRGKKFITGYNATEELSGFMFMIGITKLYAPIMRILTAAFLLSKDVRIESTHINIPDGKSSNLAFASRDYGAN